MTTIIGWDIGGAHLKAALLRDGVIEAVEQLPCTLWLGVDHLADGWRAITQQFGPADQHAVTMTGELAEIFPSRGKGVASICRTVMELAGGTGVHFYAGRSGFWSEAEAVLNWQEVASANWHASAAWIGREIGEGLFIDIGSTTTDIIAIQRGEPALRGYYDNRRLGTGELVYTGVVRTSLMALATEAPFSGRWQRLMAENFATTADLYRLSGELDPEDDSYPASDGRSKSPEDCHARIARMFGCDARDAVGRSWDHAAHFFRERQLQLICEAVAQVISAHIVYADSPFIAAGAGAFLVPEIARRFHRPARTFAELVPAREDMRRKTGVCAPAVAVALLASTDMVKQAEKT